MSDTPATESLTPNETINKSTNQNDTTQKESELTQPSTTESTESTDTTTETTVETTAETKTSRRVKKQVITTREVYCQDAIEWIKAQETIEGSVVTSLPDVCEVPMSVPEWKEWFTNCVALILQKLHPRECAIFYQTDVKQMKSDKSYLCHKGAEQVPAVKLVWHKIMSFKTDITTPTATRKKAGYSHMLCFRKETDMHFESLPDVCPRGKLLTNHIERDKIWPKGMGFDACLMAVKYAKRYGSKCIVDPFCGKGSILAVANYLGLNAIGVELSQQRARNAKSLLIDEDSLKFIWDEEGGGNSGDEEDDEDKKKKKKNKNKDKFISPNILHKKKDNTNNNTAEITQTENK